MGPLKNNYQTEPSAKKINHFSHHHPLRLSHNHKQQIPCSACTLPISTPTYGCQHCNYYLHVSCSGMPQQFQHPFDTNKNHVLKLLPKPVYPDGLFGCDACGHQGSGFSYHCSDCKIDLHVLCANMPSMKSVPGHKHQLARLFKPPYANNKFVCNVCRMPGSKIWLYSCRICEFDVHLGCTGGTQQNKEMIISSRNPQPATFIHDNQQPVANAVNHLIGIAQQMIEKVTDKVLSVVLEAIFTDFLGFIVLILILASICRVLLCLLLLLFLDMMFGWPMCFHLMRITSWCVMYAMYHGPLLGFTIVGFISLMFIRRALKDFRRSKQ